MFAWKYLYCFFCVMLLQALCPQQYCFAQAPDILWERSFGGSDNDEAERIIQTVDGGFILLGWSYSNDGDIGVQPGNSADCWIAKMDPFGNISWKKNIGGTKWDVGLDFKQTSDGGYIICGNTESNDGSMLNLALGGSDAFLLKLDALGNVQWLRTYGGSEWEWFVSVEQTTDGGYIASGYTGSNNHDVSGNHGDYDGWIVKINATGSIQWQRCIGGTNRDVAWSTKSTPDGGYVFTGYSKSTDGDITNPKGQEDLIVGKLNGQGNLVWLKNFGGSQFEWGWKLLIANDGSYVVAGYSFSSDGDVAAHYGQNDVWILKLDAQGSLIWQKVFGGSDYDDPNSIVQTSDGGFLIGGRTRSGNGHVSSNHGDNDYWILKLDVNGVLQWQKTLGGSLQDICKDVIQTTDQGYMAVGTTYSNDGDVSVKKGKSDMWIVKLGECLSNQPAVPTINSGSATPCANSMVTYSVAPVNDAIGYTWSVPAGWTILSGQGSTQITVSVGNDAGDLSVLAFNTCKFSGKRILVLAPVVVPVPQITISSNQGAGVCKGSSVVFTAQSTDAISPSYQWKKNGINVGANSTQYSDNTLSNNDLITCEVASTSPCGSPVTTPSQPIIAIVKDPVTPTITIASNLTSICQGTDVVFTATTTNGGSQPHYTWYINNIAAGSSSSFASQTLSDGDLVTCTVSSSEMCVTTPGAVSNSIAIAVNANSIAKVTIGTPATTICKNDAVTFTAIVSNAGTAPVYSWKVNGLTTGINSATFTNSNLSDQDKITCTIVPGQNTCAQAPATSNTITVTINPLPVITLYPTDTIVAPGAQVNLHAIINQDIRSFRWTPEAMLVNPSSLMPTTVPILQATEYRLSVVTPDGCRVYKDASIKPMYPLYIPNAFTPNGDGKNDLFRIPPYVEFDLSELIIFNRWGEVVFSTRDIRVGWDGRFRGVNQLSDVYVYQISGMVKEKKVLLKGNVTLIR